MDEIILKGRLKGYQRMKLQKLLDMLYTPSELAREIGFTRRQVYRVYVPLGCPNIKDDNGRRWINGREFAEWYEATYPKQTLSENEAFCLTCKKAVAMRNPKRCKKGLLHYWVSDCSNCRRKLTRIISKDKRGNDQ